jgi:methylmalonyl-CoA mutase
MSESGEGKEKKRLFSEFPRPLKEDWFKVVEKDLDGADFEKKLVWKTDEGFDIQPMYFTGDDREHSHTGFLPGEAPFVRGATALRNEAAPWSIAQKVLTPDPSGANLEILDSLARGQHGAIVQCDRAALQALAAAKARDGLADGGVCVQTVEDYALLFKNLKTKDAQIDVRGGMSSLSLLAMGILTGSIPAHVDYDPLSSLLADGTLPMNFDACMRLVADAINFCEVNKLQCSLIGVSGDCYHNAGATAVQEIAFTLAAGVEYLNGLMKHGINPDIAAGRLRFNFSAGTNFFMEIAKLRAARALWAKVMHHFGVSNEESAAMRMHVRTSWRYQTRYDPWVNMLRGTVESMAAAIGGADSIYSAPFDETVTAPGEISRRTARNLQIILQEESRIGQAIDPAAGSYYVEQLTASLAEHAWSLFREVEARGGLLASVKDGFIQKLVEDSAELKRKNIATRKEILIGTNQYPNPGEKALQLNSAHDELAARVRETVAARTPFGERVVLTEDGNLFESIMQALRAGASLSEINGALPADAVPVRVRPLPQRPAAEGFERLRKAVTSSPRKPVVFLATLGPVVWRRARATFASGFFGTAGLSVVDNPGFTSSEEAGKAAVQAGADIVVLCSDDESYISAVPVVIRELRSAGNGAQIVVAGYPKDSIDQLRVEGVNEFIYVKADVEAVLASILGTFGIDLK